MASTVARAGVFPVDTQASQIAFISAKFAISVIQILAESSLVLLVPAEARKLSICDRMLLVCSAVFLSFGLSATMPADLAISYRLPTVHPTREFVEAGGLLAYGPSLFALGERAAWYVDRILKGTKPAD